MRESSRSKGPVTEAPLHEVRTGRLLPASVERMLNSAFSRGPGYEVTPKGGLVGQGGYYIDFSAKTESPVASDVARLLPVALVQLALGWWERHCSGESGAAERFLSVLASVESRATPADGALRWPQRAMVPKYGLSRPWCSALTQGQAGSAFVRAYVLTGEPRYARLAREAVAPLRSSTGTDLVCHTSAGPILEEVPSYPPAHILNGWISALWGVFDVGYHLKDDEAAAAFDLGRACLKIHLPAYDTGWWSRYSLYPHALEDLAKPIYHRFHVAQLAAMHSLTGDSVFGETAARWQTYEGRVKTALVLGQKAAFAASEVRRRGRSSASADELSAPQLDR